MSLFNLPVEKREKPTTVHPWAKTIKEYYANRIRQAHNTVKAINTKFPKPKKERVPHPKRVKFTVIGNRVTKEFIYCVNLVQGMHRYRWKHYDTPVIRGCNGVEWGEIWQELKLKHGVLAYCIKNQVAILCNDQYLGGEKELREMIEAKYIYHLALDYQKESVNHFVKYLKASGRPCAYLHISIDEKPIGTLTFMLYSDVAPNTCENFLRLCRTKKGGYSGTPVHRIVKDGWIQCGGFGLKNISMDCENFIVPHNKRGVLGMANAGRHIDCSTQFFVLLQPNEWLKFRFVAFGQLIDGEETLKKIEAVETYYEAPTANITIYSAGILNIDCQDIRISKGALEYLDGHVEDLVSLGEMFYELLMEKLWLEIEFKKIQELMEGEGEGEEVKGEEDKGAFKKTVDDHGNVMKQNIEATRRYMQEKENEKRVKLALDDNKKKSSGASSISKKTQDNKDFDVDEYSYRPDEEYLYAQMTPIETPKKVEKYYVQWTDVPYPGEVDSNFDLKRLLQGDYCLEADLDEACIKKTAKQIQEEILNTLSGIIASYGVGRAPSDVSIATLESMDSDEELEIQEYIRENVESVSFSGNRLRRMAKNNMISNPLEHRGQKHTDEELRMIRMAFQDYKSRSKKKVSISATPWATPARIKRRQTGYVRTDEIYDSHYRLYTEDDDDDDDEDDVDNNEIEAVKTEDALVPRCRSVSISATASNEIPHQIIRRQTGYYRPEDMRPSRLQDDDDQDEPKTAEEICSGKKAGVVRIAPKTTILQKEIPSRAEQQQYTCKMADSLERRSVQMRPSLMRPSVLSRLFEDIAMDDEKEAPTLKNYQPQISEIGNKSVKLAMSDSDIGINPFLRRDLLRNRLQSIETIPKRTASVPKHQYHNGSAGFHYIARGMEPSSFRGSQWNKVRPCMTVSQYRMLNEERRERERLEMIRKLPASNATSSS